MEGRQMRVVAIILAAALIATPAWAHSLKVATWNIEHLRDTNGEGPNRLAYKRSNIFSVMFMRGSFMVSLGRLRMRSNDNKNSSHGLNTSASPSR